MPQLPPGYQLESRGNFDPLAPLLQSGVEATNGYRTEGDIQRLKREGYTPASNSDHLRGDAVDLVPGKSGMSLTQLAVKAREQFGPEAQVSIHNGTHVHVSLKGWGQAPGTPGTPRSGLPAIPEGFELEQRGALDNAAIAEKPQSAQSPDTDQSVRQVGGFADELQFNPHGAEEFHDALYQAAKAGQIKSVADAQSWAQAYNKQNGTDFGVADTPLTRQAVANAAAGKPFSVDIPQMSQTAAARLQQRVADTGDSRGASAILGAEDTITRGASDEISALGDAIYDKITGKPFDYTGNLNANRSYIESVRGEHPNYYLGGQIGGALVDPLMVNAGSVPAMAKVGAAEGGVYGFNESDGSLADRATGAGIGAVGGAVAGPVIGKTIEGVGNVASRLLNRPVEAAGAPLEGEVVPEAVGQPEALMRADSGPSVVSRRVPDTTDVQAPPTVAPGTTEQREVAAQVRPEDVAPNTAEAPPLSDVAKAANINLKNIDTPEDIDALMKFTAHTFGDFQGERRGVQSWEATAALAKDLGMTPEELLSRKTGQAFNAEQAHAARGILAASAAETRNLADKAIEGSAEDKAAFVKSFLLHAAITEKAAGAATEAGRALNIYRKVAQASIGDREAIQGAIKRLQQGATPEQLAEMVKAIADDPTALNRFARDAVKPRFRDKLMFVWINALLSGPKTHVVNMTSNLLTAMMSVPEHAIAAGLGTLRGGTDKVLLSELGPRFYGMFRGGAESLAAAREAFKVAEAGGKTDAVRPAIGGKAGRIISIPTRALNAEDAFFKGMARRSELMGLAVRKARGEGLTGDDLLHRIDHYLTNPTDEMMTAANDAALYKTFQRPLGPTGQKITDALQSNGWLKLFVPFIRTPTNLLKYATEHSPAAPLLKEVRQDFAAGGAKRDLAVARIVMGTSIAGTVAALVANHRITGGGPADPSAKRALEADGWQPYSFKLGDTYLSYRRMDPWATIIGMAADSVELQSAMTKKQQQDTGAVLIGALVQNLSNKTWLSGFSDLIDAVTDPQANAKNVLTRLGSSMATPTLSAQVAQALDPDYRDTNGDGYIDTLRKKIEARIPGASKNLIPRRDILGNEVKSEGNILARFVSPFDTSTDLHDPDAEAILQSGARFSVPSRTLKGARLPDEMYDIYQSFAGQLSKQYIKAVRTAPEWETMDKPAKAKAIEKAKNRARADARRALAS